MPGKRQLFLLYKNVKYLQFYLKYHNYNCFSDLFLFAVAVDQFWVHFYSFLSKVSLNYYSIYRGRATSRKLWMNEIGFNRFLSRLNGPLSKDSPKHLWLVGIECRGVGITCFSDTVDASHMWRCLLLKFLMRNSFWNATDAHSYSFLIHFFFHGGMRGCLPSFFSLYLFFISLPSPFFCIWSLTKKLYHINSSRVGYFIQPFRQYQFFLFSIPFFHSFKISLMNS